MLGQRAAQSVTSGLGKEQDRVQKGQHQGLRGMELFRTLTAVVLT